MDKNDIKILQVLDKDVRISARRIGKVVRINKETVNYRINKLIRDKIITSFYAVVNGAVLGYSYHKILLKYKNISTKLEEELINYLIHSDSVVWIGKCDGNWNLILTTITKDVKEFNRFYSDLFMKYGEYFMDKEILQIIKGRAFNDKFIYENKELTYSLENDLTKPKVKFDEFDLIILGLLSLNSRINYTEIANKIHFSSEAVSFRIKQLFKKGILVGFKPRLDFSKFGYDYFHIFLSIKNIREKNKILNYYKHHYGCVVILEYIGKYDIQLEFVLASNKELRAALDDLRDKFGNVLQDYAPLTIYKEYTINLFPIKSNGLNNSNSSNIQ